MAANVGYFVFQIYILLYRPNLYFKYNLEVSPVSFAKTANLHFEQPFGDLAA